MSLFYVKLDDFDGNKSIQLRLWAKDHNILIISVAQGKDNSSMYVRSSLENIIALKNEFNWIDDYKLDTDDLFIE